VPGGQPVRRSATERAVSAVQVDGRPTDQVERAGTHAVRAPVSHGWAPLSGPTGGGWACGRVVRVRLVVTRGTPSQRRVAGQRAGA
jgi:hypothetical protein